jgi:hypothetical protein
MSARPARGKVPLAAPEERRELFTRLADSEHMLGVFRHELSRLTEQPIRVTSCKAKLRRTRAAARAGRIEVVYRVGIEQGGLPEREYILLGTAPEGAEFLLGTERRSPVHPRVLPFHASAVHLAELDLGLLFFPMDPALPALGEITGDSCASLLAPYLQECRAGHALERVDCELKQYKPFKRAVLRLTAHFSESGAPSRSFYAKLFTDECGRDTYRELSALWSAVQSASYLRLPEPLGYDAERRMLLLSEAPGQRDLSDWVRCLERGRPLPPGVGLARAERCMVSAARGLVELQRSGIRPARTFTSRSVLERLRRDLVPLRGRLPGGLLREVEQLLTLLSGRVPVAESLVPAHGCYRHKQMVGDERGLFLIDWDGLALADAAMDAATFLGKLRQKHLRQPGSAPQLERLAALFRSEFLAGSPQVTAGQLALQEGIVIAEDLLRSFRVPADERMPDEIRNLLAAARASLETSGPR